MATISTTKRVHFSPSNWASRSDNAAVLLLGQSDSSTKRLSASCQQVTDESFEADKASVQVRSCLADSQLYPIIAGHKCNKVPLCPSALYADMALTVGIYIWTTLRPNTEIPGVNVCEMEVPKPLVAQVPQSHPGQFIELDARAELDENNADSGLMKCTFRSVHPDGTKIQDNAHCNVRYESKAAWAHEWSRFAHMVNNSIKILHEKSMSGGAHRMQRGLAYKVFESFVTYSDIYHSMSEVIFDGLEGTATIGLQTTDADHRGPYHLDGTSQLSGFLSNASDLDSEDYVYISEGWQSAKVMDMTLITHGPRTGSQLVNYAHMQSKPKQILEGDVYVVHDGKVVAVWEGVKFKRIPRKVLNIVLPPPKTV